MEMGSWLKSDWTSRVSTWDPGYKATHSRGTCSLVPLALIWLVPLFPKKCFLMFTSLLPNIVFVPLKLLGFFPRSPRIKNLFYVLCHPDYVFARKIHGDVNIDNNLTKMEPKVKKYRLCLYRHSSKKV